MGRPTTFSQQLVDRICKRISEGESLRTICKDNGMPALSSVLLWVTQQEHKDFSEQYERACNARAEHIFDGLLEIADKKKGETVSRSRLRVDTRKWYLSKVLPKKFGDKVDITSDNKPIPLLHVLHNDSDKENPGTSKKD